MAGTNTNPFETPRVTRSAEKRGREEDTGAKVAESMKQWSKKRKTELVAECTANPRNGYTHT